MIEVAKASLSLIVLGSPLRSIAGVLNDYSDYFEESEIVNGLVLGETLNKITEAESFTDVFKMVAINKFLSTKPQANINELEEFYKQISPVAIEWERIINSSKGRISNGEQELLYDLIISTTNKLKTIDPIISHTLWELTKLFPVPAFINTAGIITSSHSLQSDITKHTFSLELTNIARQNGAQLIKSTQSEKREWVDKNIFFPLSGISLYHDLNQIRSIKSNLENNPILKEVSKNSFPTSFTEVPEKIREISDLFNSTIQTITNVESVINLAERSYDEIKGIISSTTSSINLLSCLIELTGHESLAKKVSEIGGTAIKIVTGISEFVNQPSFSIGGLTSSLLGGNIFGAALSLFGLGSTSPSEGEKKILEKLDKIDKGIEEIKATLVVIDKKIDLVIQQIDIILKEQRLGFASINTTINQLGIEVINALKSFEAYQRDSNLQINILGNYIVSILQDFRQEVIDQQRDMYYNIFKISWNKAFVRDSKVPLTQNDFNDCATAFYTYAETTSGITPFQRPLADPGNIKALGEKLFIGSNPSSIWTNLKIISQFARAKYKHPSANSDVLFNPVIFAMGCEAYLRLIEEHKPKNFSTLRIQNLIRKAEQLIDWMSSFSYEKSSNKLIFRDDFFKNVLTDYFEIQNQLISLISEEVTKFQLNTDNGLVSSKGNKQIDYELKFASWTDYSSGVYTSKYYGYRAHINSLEFPSKMQPRKGASELPELDTPVFIIKLIPEEYLVNEILHKQNGKGFRFEYELEDFPTLNRVTYFIIYIYHKAARESKICTIKFMAPVKKEPIHWRYSDRRYPHPKKKMDYVDTYFDILTKDGLSDWWSQTKQKIGNKHSYYVTYDKGDRGSFEYEKNKNYQGLYEDGDFWYQTVAELVILDLSIGDEYRKNNQVLINSIKAKMMLPIRKALIQDPENTMQKIASLARDFNAIALYIDYCKYLINPNQYSGRQVMNSIDIAERLSSDISYRFDADGKFLLELYNFTDLKPAPYFFYFENISPSIVKSILFKLKAAERILSKTSAT